jgi:hypothetical protein
MVMSTVPADSAGERAVQDVLETQAAKVDVDPKLAAVPSTKPVPVMLTSVPPPRGPAAGVTALTLGTRS